MLRWGQLPELGGRGQAVTWQERSPESRASVCRWHMGGIPAEDDGQTGGDAKANSVVGRTNCTRLGRAQGKRHPLDTAPWDEEGGEKARYSSTQGRQTTSSL